MNVLYIHYLASLVVYLVVYLEVYLEGAATHFPENT